MLLTTCPAPTALTAISAVTCFEDFGQIQCALFQRKLNGTTKNSFTIATADPKLKASWTALKAATDSTKVVTAPIFAEPTHDGGEPRTYGSGNAVPNGIPEIIGENPSNFTAKFLRLPQSIKNEIYNLVGEKSPAVYLVNEAGWIGGLVDNLTTPTKFYPIPVLSLFIGGKKFGGFENPDSNMIQWSFPANALDMFYIMKPTDFDALTEI